MQFSIRKTIAAAAAVIAATFALFGCGGGTVKSPDILPHLTYAENSGEPPVDRWAGYELPVINGELTAEQYRDRVRLLYDTVVYDNKRPVFSADDPTERIYTAARNVLSDHVEKEWYVQDGGDYKIVHVIHDWLVCRIDYDFELYKAYVSGNTELGDEPAFYIDGVFADGKAVCDGLARAFVFLCAMADVDSIRVTGSYSSSPHAWNKVKVGGKWYNVDVTSDAAYYTASEKMYKQISHGYFLVSDSAISEFRPNAHDFVPQPYTADAEFDFYTADPQYITVGGKIYSAVITDKRKLNELFSAIGEQKGRVGKIEVKLDFDGKTQVNQADMYENEIREAYGKLKDPGFVFSGSNKPYFRYPNGVYMFLMYK